jgi:chromatin remodeling complex protein RSC6
MSSLTQQTRSRAFVSPLFGTLEVSSALAAVIGVGQSSRLEATERLHAYVTKKGLSKGDGTVQVDERLRALATKFELRSWVTDAELFEAVARNLT